MQLTVDTRRQKHNLTRCIYAAKYGVMKKAWAFPQALVWMVPILIKTKSGTGWRANLLQELLQKGSMGKAHSRLDSFYVTQSIKTISLQKL